ncbi:MAG TPA: hypothetical protein IAA29_00650 [Candidatus Paenibacillus intestinavium]|nr:hypothetical protein [Candidatus Paenibacillus intestinavium]
MSNVLALVKMNGRNALVLNNEPKYTYYKHGNLIIGIDDECLFITCYVYSTPTPGFYAFGGHKFDITLDNDEIIHCYGQYWDGGYEKATDLLGIELTTVSYRGINELKNCYVFTGSTIIKEGYERLVQEYTGKVYEYREYENFLRSESSE